MAAFTHSRILVFDVDGVITNPHTTELNQSILDIIGSDLRTATPVALNTGRSVEWIIENFVPRLPISGDDGLEYLLCVGEKGGVRAEFVAGQPRITDDTSLLLPDAFLHELADLEHTLSTQNGRPLADYLFRDNTKRTMATWEKYPQTPIADFEEPQKILVTHLKHLLKTHDLTEDYWLHSSLTALDISHKTTGKHAGAQQIVRWLHKRQAQANHLFCFGDDPNDEAMAEEFAKLGYETTFVYVGRQQLRTTETSHKRVILHGNYDIDTLAYLKRL